MNLGLLLIGLLLVGVNGFFVAAEFSLIAVRRSQVEELANADAPRQHGFGQHGFGRHGFGRRGRRARLALACLDRLPLMLAGSQLAITVCSLALGSLAEPVVAHALEGWLESASLPHGLIATLAVVVSLTIVTVVHTVLGEMVAKNVALAAPLRTLLFAALPFRVLTLVLRPFIVALEGLGAAGLRVLGLRGHRADSHTADELAAMVAESRREGAIEEFEHRLLTGAIGFGTLDVGAVMIPRTDVVAHNGDAPAGRAIDLVSRSGRSRLPVYEHDVDHIVGFVHAKDLLDLSASDLDAPLSPGLVREMLIVPESRRLGDLLVDMKRRRMHFALVVDEHGGTAGVCTLEDVLEELVGEIRDEHDRREQGVRRVAADRLIVPGSLRIDQLAAAADLVLPEGDYDTVAGFVLSELGRIPDAGDVVRFDEWQLVVRRLEGRRIATIEVVAPGAGRSSRRSRALHALRDGGSGHDGSPTQAERGAGGV